MNQIIEATKEIPPIRKQSLFELGAIVESLETRLDNALHESEGVITPEIEEIIEELLPQNSAELIERLDNIGALLATWEVKAKARRADAKRLCELAKVDENKIERMKERVKNVLEFIGKDTVETPRYKFNIAVNGGVLPLIINEEADAMNIPVEYQKPTFDNAAIRQALDAGIELEFASLGERGKSLRIR